MPPFCLRRANAKARTVSSSSMTCSARSTRQSRPEVSSESWSLPTLLGCATHQVLEVSHDSGQQLLFTTWLLWVANLEQPAILAHGLDLPANDRGACQRRCSGGAVPSTGDCSDKYDARQVCQGPRAACDALTASAPGLLGDRRRRRPGHHQPPRPRPGRLSPAVLASRRQRQ